MLILLLFVFVIGWFGELSLCDVDVVVSDVVSVEMSVESGRPFKHYWKKSFGSGHASLTLREVRIFQNIHTHSNIQLNQHSTYIYVYI